METLPTQQEQSHGKRKAVSRSSHQQYPTQDPPEVQRRGKDSDRAGRVTGEDSIAELCRREGISESLYYSWSKEFLEAGKSRLTGDTKREATSGEVKDLKQENDQLKQVVAELLLKNRTLKKSLSGMEAEWED